MSNGDENDKEDKTGHDLQSDPNDKDDPYDPAYSFKSFLNPIVALAGIIVSSVIFLIGFSMFGFDAVLHGLAQPAYARGLITYLFAVVTIGTAVVLVVSALTGPATDQHKEQFQRGKEILSLLLGVFGTIVGFYFGSEAVKGAGEEALKIAPLHVSSQILSPNDKFQLTTVVSGGQPPYHFGVGFDGATIQTTDLVDETRWIDKDENAPLLTDKKEKIVQVELKVVDAAGQAGQQSTKITVKPSP